MTEREIRVKKLRAKAKRSILFRNLLTFLKPFAPNYKYLFAKDGEFTLCEYELENIPDWGTMMLNEAEDNHINLSGALSTKYNDVTALFERKGGTWGISMINGTFFDELLLLDQS